MARKVSHNIKTPTIGIGASSAWDGQILVLEDMLGLTDWTPKFVKPYAQLGHIIDAAVADYVKEIKTRQFLTALHVYGKV